MAEPVVHPPAFLEGLAADRTDKRLIADFSGLAQGFRVIKPVELSVRLGHASLYGRADDGAALLSQCLLGEPIRVLAQDDDWLYVQCLTDGYLGFIRADAIGSAVQTSHRIAAPASHIYPAAHIKSAPGIALSMGALLRVTGPVASRMCPVEQGWVPEQHLRPLGEALPEPAVAARAFLGSPYLWGGRTSAGLDCSALVQLSFAAAGVALPRDTNQQQKYLQADVGHPDDLESGDLVFFPGHVGIFSGQGRLIHANAHHMSTVEEPLADVIDRLEKSGDRPAVTALKRP